MKIKSIVITSILVFGLLIIGKPVSAIYQYENTVSTTKHYKSQTFKFKFFQKIAAVKLKQKGKTLAEKIKRNANLALGFGVGTFATLFAAVLIFELPALLIITLLLLLMGILFSFKTIEQIKKEEEDFFAEKSKAKIGLVFTLVTLGIALLTSLYSIIFW
jgi:hypothetical protein